jgi:hypothetical protein
MNIAVRNGDDLAALAVSQRPLKQWSIPVVSADLAGAWEG